MIPTEGQNNAGNLEGYGGHVGGRFYPHGCSLSSSFGAGVGLGVILLMPGGLSGPFFPSTYFDVHQGYRVLTHSHLTTPIGWWRNQKQGKPTGKRTKSILGDHPA